MSPSRASNSGAAGTTALLGQREGSCGGLRFSMSLSERIRSTSSSQRRRASTLLKMLVRLAGRNEKSTSFFCPLVSSGHADNAVLALVICQKLSSFFSYKIRVFSWAESFTT